MQVSPPLVSIIMPAYNAAATIGAALASAQAQTEPRVEILVVDDGSTDDTAEIVREAAATDPRIRLLRAPCNAGPAATRNRGIAAACGEWIALLDADDGYLPERVGNLLALADAHPADMVADNIALHGCGNDGRAMIPARLLDRPQHLSAAAFVERNIGTRRDPRVSYGFLKPMIRRAFLERHGLSYDERNRFGEDFLLYLACLMHGAVWWLTPEPTYLYTVRAGSLTEVQSPGDLDRIRSAEQQLLADPRVAKDARLARALRRHKRRIDRGYYYRAFTDALKQRQFGRARAVLFDNAGSIGHVARETLTQAPVILAKALGGGYRRHPQAANEPAPAADDVGRYTVRLSRSARLPL